MEESILNVFREIPQREYLNSFFSYSETIDIYHTVLLLTNGYDEDPPKPAEGGISVTIKQKKNYLSPKIEGINMIFEKEQDLFTYLEQCQEGLEMQGIPQKQSMYSLFLLQMGLYTIESQEEIPSTFIPFSLEDEPRLIKSMYISRLLSLNPRDWEDCTTSSKVLTSTNILFCLSNIVKTYIHKLSSLDANELNSDQNAFLDLEYETKISLNNFFLI